MVSDKVFMKYCPICKRYFPVAQFAKHMSKHKTPKQMFDEKGYLTFEDLEKLLKTKMIKGGEKS